MGCGGGDVPGSDGPIVSKDYIDVAPNLQLLGNGQETELKISTNCRWIISYSANWLTVSPSSGSNDEIVKVSAGKNTTGQDRSVILTIQGGNAPTRSVVVTQPKGTEEPVSKSLSTNTTSLSFDANGEEKSFTINSNTTWTISKPEWCTLSKSSGEGNAVIKVTAIENPDKEQRTGQIVVTGKGTNTITIFLTQNANKTNSTSYIQGMIYGYDKGKNWTWDFGEKNTVWGSMGYCGGVGHDVGTAHYGEWWGITSEEEFLAQLKSTNDGSAHGDESADAFMTLTPDGIITRYAGNGSVIKSGFFSIDESVANDWKVANLNTTAGTILWPYEINSGGKMPTTFEVVYLTNSKMCLVYPDGGAFESLGGWGEATFWHFKAK